MENAFKARSRIELVYSESLARWEKTVEKEVEVLDIYKHERVLVDMIVSIGKRASEISKDLAENLIEVSGDMHKQCDLFFGDLKFGQLENIQDFNNKFKVFALSGTH